MQSENLLKLCTSPTRSGKGHDVANNSYIVARPWLGRHLLLRGVASAPPAPPTPLGGVAGGRASSLRELTSPTHRLRGAASGGITSSPTWESGNWWQHGLTPKSERRCWKVPLRLDACLKKTLAGTTSNNCMAPKTLQIVGKDGRGPHLWLLEGMDGARIYGCAHGRLHSESSHHLLTDSEERQVVASPRRRLGRAATGGNMDSHPRASVLGPLNTFKQFL